MSDPRPTEDAKAPNVPGKFRFRSFVGIDYSGAELPGSRLKNLRVFISMPGTSAREEFDGRIQQGRWSRKRVREWLLTQVTEAGPVLIGIDHGFSLPSKRLEQQGVRDWDDLLSRFERVVATHHRRVSAALGDPRSAELIAGVERPEGWYRLCEKRTQQASSVLDYRPKRVAHSTMAGIAELAVLRREALGSGANLHFWPFDGFDIPAATSVIVEIYPALLKRRFPYVGADGPDQCDARCAADWLRTIVEDGHLSTYLDPPLTPSQRKQALLEGWILGVM